MIPFKEEKTKSGMTLTHALACLSVFVYIVSAVAFEMTSETAFISTFAIYIVFGVGLLFVFQGGKNIIINEYFLLIVFFCVFVYFRNMAENASNSNGMSIAYSTLTCTVVCVLVFWMSSKYSNLFKFAMVAYVLGAMILSLRIISEYGGISEMINYASAEGENRVGGLLGNENGIGLFLANGILVSLIFFLKNKKLIVKILTLLIMLSLGTMVLFTGSRQSLAFVLLGILIVIYFNYRKAKLAKKLFIILLIAVVAFLIFYAITTLPMFSTINERLTLLFEGFFGGGSSYDTDRTREMMISEGLKAFFEKPVLGHGTGYSYTLFGTYSHNNFVELLMNYGMVGFALYYAVYLFVLAKLWSLVRRGDIYAIYFFTYTCVQLLLGAVGSVNYYSRPTQIVTALAFGYLYRIKMSKNEIELNENRNSIN